MTARDDYPDLGTLAGRENVKFYDHQVEAANALDEIDRLRDELERLHDILDGNLTFRDLEMKIRDGTITVNTVVDTDSTAAACQRWLTAMCYHVLLGDDNDEPDNYRAWKADWSMKPGGEFDPIRLHAEVVKPGGRASHEIRLDLEQRIAAVRTIVEASKITRKREVLGLLDITPAPPQPPMEPS